MNHLRYICNIVAVTAFLSILSSCSKNDEPDIADNQEVSDPSTAPGEDTPEENGDKPGTPDKTAPRTVLIYMVADNSLGKGEYDEDDIKEINSAVSDGALDNGGRLLIYHNRPGTDTGTAPVIAEITPDGRWSVMKKYPDDASIYSTDASRMREVFDDVRRLAPANDYGVIFWSHSTGWIEEEEARSSYIPPILRSYGDDRRRRMSIPTLASVLSDYNHSFIYFDCCMMATVEVIYELRHSAPMIAASGAEVHGEGMPYDITLPYFFAKGEADIVGVANATYKYYNNRNGVDRWSTQSVVDTSHLDELAAVTREIMKTGGIPSGSMYDYQSYTPSVKRYRIFDMADYISRLDGVPADMLTLWEETMSRTVIFKANTPMVNGSHRIEKYCGLGCNIIFDKSETTQSGYNNLAWWNDVVSYNPSYR